MKKIILPAAMLLAIGFTAKAQDIKFGIKAGLNIATLNGDKPTEDPSARTGFHAGAVAEFKISPNFSIQPELLYSQQGTKFDVNDTDASYETTFKFDYLNLPVVAKYYIIEGLSVEAGPQIGFRLNSKIKLDVPEASVEADAKDEIKAIDFGLVGGVAYDLPIGVFFQVRYSAGVSDIFEDNEINSQNGVFQLSVGYKF